MYAYRHKKEQPTIDEAVIEGESKTVDQTFNASLVHNPYTTKVNIHIHHWQIFYVLAFFTRYKVHTTGITIPSNTSLDSHTLYHK